MVKFLRPNDLAKAAHVSAQLVRNYEELGFIPRAERSDSGYRLYTPLHLRALHVARVCIAGLGWQQALTIMQAIHTQDGVDSVVQLIDERHAQIHQRRKEIQGAIEILRQTTNFLTVSHAPVDYRKPEQLLYVQEAARLVGVRVSALRFWEQEGLLTPVRHPENNYRMYNQEQVRRLQVIALLRKTGYDFAAIRPVLVQLAAGSPERVLQAAEKQLRHLVQESRACIEATTLLWSYIEEYQQAVSMKEEENKSTDALDR